MEITRNGQTFTLTDDELKQAADEYHRNHDLDFIKNVFADYVKTVHGSAEGSELIVAMSEEQYKDIANLYKENLDLYAGRSKGFIISSTMDEWFMEFCKFYDLDRDDVRSVALAIMDENEDGGVNVRKLKEALVTDKMLTIATPVQEAMDGDPAYITVISNKIADLCVNNEDFLANINPSFKGEKPYNLTTFLFLDDEYDRITGIGLDMVLKSENSELHAVSYPDESFFPLNREEGEKVYKTLLQDPEFVRDIRDAKLELEENEVR